MAANRIWPGTPEERRDRSCVMDLIDIVGRDRLRFGVQHLRDEMRRNPRLRLEHSGELARHVHDLGPSTLIPVEKQLYVGAGADAARGSRHTWVLRERWDEYVSSPPELADLERVHAALHLACAAMGGEAVPTRAVTDLLQGIDGLALGRPAQTALHLTTLASRGSPLAEKVGIDGQRWNRWIPMGAPPDHPMMEEWKEQARQILVAAPRSRPEASETWSEAARELVILGIRSLRSRDLPYGRPVQVNDLRAVAAENTRAAYLLDKLQQGGRKLHVVLGDASRARIASADRRDRRVVRLPRRVGSFSHYDVPDEPGHEQRLLFLPWQDLQVLSSHSAVSDLAEEYRQAVQLSKSDDRNAAAIGAIRIVRCWDDIKDLETLVSSLEQAAQLPAQVRRSLPDVNARLAEVVREWGTPRAGEDRARAAITASGVKLSLRLLKNVARPLVPEAHLIGFAPSGGRGTGTAAAYLKRKSSLAKYPNPAFVSRTDPDPLRSAVTCVDRVEALLSSAEQGHSKLTPFLQAGSKILGRRFRHPALLRAMAEHGSKVGRSSALAALVLLGADDAIEVSLAWLRDPTTEALRVEYALYALLMMQRVRPDEWPEHLRRPTEPGIRRVWLEVIRAAQHKRWLLQW
jgi:hypothetical protein